MQPSRFRQNSIVRSLAWKVGEGRPRVHIEDHDPERFMNVVRALHDAGFEIGPFCGGPHFNDSGTDPFCCPFVESGECNAVDEADVILFRYGLESRENVELLDRLLHGPRPRRVVVETPPATAASHAVLLEGCRVLAAPATVADIVAAVRQELPGSS